MGLSLLTLAMSQKYTNDSLVGVGAIKGSPCTIKEIVKENGINTITYEWTAEDGTKRTAVMTVEDGEDGTDGFAPIIRENSSNNQNSYRLDIITGSGTFTTPNLKGADGSGGGGGGTGSLIWGTFS